MKKLLIFALALCLLLCACGDGNQSDNSEVEKSLSEAISVTNSETAFSGSYMLEINFGQGVSLYYANGKVECNRSEKKASIAFAQTYLGVSANRKNYIANGKAISVDGETATEVDVDTNALLSKFPYSQMFSLPEEVGEIAVNESMVGRTYTVTRNDTEIICDSVVGGDIYDMVDVLKQPQKDKTEYGETKCIYTVSEGRVTGVRYEFDVKLYDTPAYIPGYSVPESEYTITLHITAKLSYDKFGGEVTVGEYSEGEEAQSKAVSE